MAASKNIELTLQSGARLRTPDVCVVCHAQPTSSVELRATKSDNNVDYHYSFSVRICEDCAQRSSQFQGIAVVVAAAIFILGAIAVFFVFSMVNGDSQEALSEGIGGLVCPGLVLIPVALASWGIAKMILVDNGGLHVRGAVRLNPNASKGWDGLPACSLMFSDKAYAIATARLNVDRIDLFEGATSEGVLGRVMRDAQRELKKHLRDNLDEWMKDEDAARRADEWLNARQPND